MKPKQDVLATARVSNSGYFSPKVIISFQLLIYQILFLNLKICFQIASALLLLSINYNFVRT